MSTFLMSGTRLRLTNVATKQILRKWCFIEGSFALGIRIKGVLKHFNRRKIQTMISQIRLEVDASLDADELHDPRSIRLQNMRILLGVHKHLKKKSETLIGADM